jgi:hypothetical protein
MIVTVNISHELRHVTPSTSLFGSGYLRLPPDYDVSQVTCHVATGPARDMSRQDIHVISCSFCQLVASWQTPTMSTFTHRAPLPQQHKRSWADPVLNEP